MELRGVTCQESDACLEDESEQMIRIFAENGISLRLRERERSCDFANPSHVVALIGVQGGEQLIGEKSHWGEELYAVSLSLGREHHHSIVQTISALLR